MNSGLLSGEVKTRVEPVILSLSTIMVIIIINVYI